MPAFPCRFATELFFRFGIRMLITVYRPSLDMIQAVYVCQADEINIDGMWASEGCSESCIGGDRD